MNRRRVTVIDPDDCTAQERDRVDRWLEANGARYQAMLEPITITHTRRGDVIEYVAAERRDRHGEIPALLESSPGYLLEDGDRVVLLKPGTRLHRFFLDRRYPRRRRVWQRIPLEAVA